MKRRKQLQSKAKLQRTRLKRRRAKVRKGKQDKLQQDMECKAKVLERDDYTCQRCGRKDGLQWHHVVKRSKSALLRHDLDNGLTLCAGCHKFWWHLDEHAAMNWFIAKWPERNEKLAKLRELPLWVGREFIARALEGK